MKQAQTRAFAMVEAVTVVGLIGALLAICLPSIAEQRRAATIKADLNSLRLIAQASAMYADASDERLFTFTWKPGEVPATPNTELALSCASLNPSNPSSYTRAVVLQQLDLVTHGFKDERLPPIPSTAPPNHTPYPYFNHLVLNRFMGSSLPSELFISKADTARAYWKRNIDAYLDNPVGSRVRPPTSETSFLQLWRWPFSSSYQIGPSHYSIDFAPPTTVQRTGTHRTWQVPTTPGVLGTRTMSEVAFPGQKVLMFDEFDRYNAEGTRYFALDGASNVMNFYDGHAARLLTSDSNYGFNPNDPDFGAENPDEPSVAYFYQPITWWDPPGAVRTMVPVYYDQTRNGLQGVDYPGK